MPVEQLTNGQTATLTSPISSHVAGATVTIGVDAIIGVADTRQMRVEIGRELFLVTAGMGTLSMTATAAVEGTTPSAHDAGVAVVQVVTAAGISNLQTLPTNHGHSSTIGDGGNLRGIQNGYAPLDSGLLVPIANIPTGTTSTTVALGNDSRFPTSSEKTALAGTSGTAVSGANKLVDNADPRNTDSRTPTVHAIGGAAHTGSLAHSSLSGLTSGDPHTQYQQESEKGAVSGYASLDSSTLVPKAQLGSGTADNTTYLRGDGTWNTPSAGASTSFAGARVYNTANISVSSGGSGTTLTFDTERYDTDAFHSTSSNTSRLTVPSGKGGKYHMEGHAQFASGTTGERELRVLLNGATIIAVNTEQGLIAENVTVHVSTDYELAVGDYVELVAFQDGIGSLNVLAAGNYSPEFSCSLWGAGGLINPMTTTDDIIVGGASGAPTRVAKGSNNTVWGVNGSGTLGYKADPSGAFSGVRLTKSGTQSVNSASFTDVTFDGETFDTDAYHSLVSNTGRITFPTTGYYNIGGTINFQNDTGGSYRIAAIAINGGVQSRHDQGPGGASNNWNISTETLYYATAGDYATLQFYQDRGSAVNVGTASIFWAYRVG